MYHVKVLADSVSEAEVRLTTLEVTLPRLILAEFNTHRVFSRNSASSRAIPPEKLIHKVLDDPFVPILNKRVKGMGVGPPLQQQAQILAEISWLDSRDQAVKSARQLLMLDVDKSRINRLLEPFLWQTVIVSATEWSNFYALRTHESAQPEFQKIAIMMRDAMEESEPDYIPYGNWHLPLVHETIEELPRNKRALVSAGRCARVSYDRQHDAEDPDVSHERALKLAAAGHWSPFEHPAAPVPYPNEFHGNFRGWMQLRKTMPGESDFSKLQEMSQK